MRISTYTKSNLQRKAGQQLVGLLPQVNLTKSSFGRKASMQVLSVLMLLLMSWQLQAQTCTVNSGTPTTYCEGETMLLNGLISSFNGDPTSVVWSIVLPLPAGANVIIDNPNQVSTTISGTLPPGDYTFELQQTCTDNSGMPTQQVTHTIVQGVSAPVLPASPAAACFDGASTPIMVTGPAPGPGETVRWSFASGSPYTGTLTNENTQTVSFVPNLTERDCVSGGGSHRTFLEYTVSNGSCSMSDVIEVPYYYSVDPFYVTAIPEKVCVTPACIDLYASCSLDGVGLWTASGPGIATFASESDAITTVCVDRDGDYTFTYTVTGGCRPGSDSDMVTVAGFGSGLTVTDAGPDATFCEFPSTYVLNATPLNNGQTGLWTQLTGLPVTINDPTSASTTFDDMQPGGGPYTFSWQVFSGECGIYDIVTYGEKTEIFGSNKTTALCFSDFSAGAIWESDLIDAAGFDTVWLSITPLSYPSDISGVSIGNNFRAIDGGATCRNLTSGGSLTQGQTGTYVFSKAALTVNGSQCPGLPIKIITGLNFATRTDGIYEFLISVNNGCEIKEFPITFELGNFRSGTINAGTDAILPCGEDETQLSGNFIQTSPNSPNNAAQWTMLSGPGPSPLTLATVNQAQPMITGLVDGTYVFQYAHENNGICGTLEDQVQIVVSSGIPPAAVASVLTASPCSNGPVELTGNLPEGTVGTWSQITPATPLATITDVNDPDAILSDLQASTAYTFRWTLENGCGTDFTDVNFTTGTGTGPSPAIIDNDFYCSTGGNFTVVANPISSGTGTWTQISGPLTLSFAQGNSSTTNVLGVATDETYVIRWTVTTGDGTCDDTVFDEVTIGRFTVPDAGMDAILCNAAAYPYDYQLAGSSVVTGEWFLHSGPGLPTYDDATSPTAIATFPAAGVYQLRYTILDCASDIVTITIGDQPPVAFAGDDQLNCAADGDDGNFVLEALAVAPASGSWSVTSTSGPTVTFGDASSPTSTATLSGPGQVTLRWSVTPEQSFCSPSEDEVLLIWLDAEPVPFTETFCGISATFLEANNMDFDNTGMEWSQVGATPSVAVFSEPFNANTAVSNLVPGTYTFRYAVSYEGPLGTCNVSEDITLTIEELILADAGVDQSFCGGETITLTGNTPSAGSVSWSQVLGPNSGTLSASTSEVTTYGPLTADSTYVFQYSVTNGNCTSTDLVFIYPVAISNVSYTTVDATCGMSDGNIDLTVEGSDGTAFTYLWSNGAITEDLVGVSAGLYMVTVTHPSGCSVEIPVSLASSDGPTVVLDDVSGACLGQNITLTSMVSGGSGNYSYLWNTGETTPSLDVMVSANDTTLVLQVTDLNDGCITSAEVTIFSKVSTEVNLGPDVSICAGPIMLNAALTIPISPEINTSPPFYSESFEADLGGWVQSSAPDDDIDWRRNMGGTPTGFTGPSGASDGDYYIYFDPDDGATGDVAILTSPVIDLSAQVSPVLSFDYNIRINFAAFGNGTIALEAFDGTVWTQLWVESGNKGTQWQSENIDLMAYGGQADFQIRFVATKGTSGTFEYDMAFDNLNIGGGRFDYLWSNGEITPSITVNPGDITMATTYSVTVTDNLDGCIATDDVIISAPPTLTGGNEVCIGQTVTLTGSGTPNATNPYVSDDDNIATVTSGGVVTGVAMGTVNIAYTDDSGCTVTAAVMVNASPVVTLNDPADACPDGTDMSFTGTPAPAAGTTGVFSTTAAAGFIDNGDGTASLDVSTAGSGTYDVTYIYTNTNGCAASEVVSVAVLEVDTLVITALASCDDGNGDQVSANTYYVEVSTITGGNGGPYSVTVPGAAVPTQTFDGTGSLFFGPFTHSGTGGQVRMISATDNGASASSCEAIGTYEVPEVLCGINDGGQDPGCFCAGPTTDPTIPTSSILAQSQPGTFQTGGTSGQVQRYILVDASGNIVETNFTGLFADVAPGTYTPYAINYRLDEEATLLPYLDAGDPIQPILDGLNGTGDLAGLCYTTCNVDTPVTYTTCTCYSVGSTVFTDLDNDGMFGSVVGEAGIENVTIELLNAGGMVIGTTTTDANGDYYFGGLGAGNYSLNIPTPNAVSPISSTVTDIMDNGEDNDDNGVQPDPMGPVNSSSFELGGVDPEPSGVTETGTGGAQDDGASDVFGDMTQDFGFFAPVSIGDTAFFDLNEDGLLTIGEPGVPGVTVTLLDQNGDAVTMDLGGNDLTNVMTDANGGYLFDSLPPGIYSVQFDYSTVTDAGLYDFTTANVGGNDATDSDNSITVNATTAQSDPTDFLSSGESDLTLDVGLICAVEVTVAEPSTICSSQPIDLTQGASITPASLGGTWSTPDGSLANFDGGTDFATATTYTPDAADLRRGSVTLVLTTNDPTGVCGPESAMVTIEILNVDCGSFFWDGGN